MKKVIPVILLVLQVYLVLQGSVHFGKLGTPFVLLAVSMALPLYALFILLNEREQPGKKAFSLKRLAIGTILGIISIAAFYNQLRSVFDEFKSYTTMSDVIAQLETLYMRFSSGIFPYAPLEQYPWHPFPVYMPLHWLPVGLSGLLHCDVRWISVLFLGIAFIAWSIYVIRVGSYAVAQLFSIALPCFVLWAFLKWNTMEVAVSFEPLIAGYYLLLAVGLFGRSLPLVTIGIICCLLSRYTMVFWLPLFIIMLWSNAATRTNYIVWAGIIISVLALYFIPFYLQHPSILTDGLAYHNHCYVDAWNGLGHPEEATVFDNGLNFSWFVREATSGPMSHRVMVGRGVQAGVMLLLTIVGYLGYKKWRTWISFYDYALIMLYSFLLLFFMLSPLTYKYYFLPLCMISAVLVGRLLLSGQRTSRE